MAHPHRKILELIDLGLFNRWRTIDAGNAVGSVESISLQAGTRDGLCPLHYCTEDQLLVQVCTECKMYTLSALLLFEIK